MDNRATGNAAGQERDCEDGMKVKIMVEFDVDGLEDHELTESDARSAASQAAYDYLTFCTVSGYNDDADEVEVTADGYGKCSVRLGDDHG